jgi:hypothetical protein
LENSNIPPNPETLKQRKQNPRMEIRQLLNKEGPKLILHKIRSPRLDTWDKVNMGIASSVVTVPCRAWAVWRPQQGAGLLAWDFLARLELLESLGERAIKIQDFVFGDLRGGSAEGVDVSLLTG